MKKIGILFLSGSLLLSACVPSLMLRDQNRFGLMNWMAGAAKEGHLDVVVYGTRDTVLKDRIVKSMNGHTQGPSVILRQAADSGKGARMVVVLDPDPSVYADALCKKPEGGFPSGQKNKVAFALCYNDLSYGNVIATSLIEDMNSNLQEFDDFYSQAARILSDPRYEKQHLVGNCNNAATCL